MSSRALSPRSVLLPIGAALLVALALVSSCAAHGRDAWCRLVVPDWFGGSHATAAANLEQ